MRNIANKSNRVLYIYEQLLNGHIVNVDDIATKFKVSNRTVHKDMEAV